jgi:hypothetical protein
MSESKPELPFPKATKTLEDVIDPGVLEAVRAFDRESRTGNYVVGISAWGSKDLACPVGACYHAKYRDTPIPAGMVIPCWPVPNDFLDPSIRQIYPPLLDDPLVRDVALALIRAYDATPPKERGAVDWTRYPVEVLTQ